MSTNRTDYILYGWKMPYDLKDKNGEEIDFWEEKYEDFTCGVDRTFSLVVDGMSGGYSAFGKRFASGGDKYEGWGFEEIKIEEMNPEEVRAKYVELLNVEPVGEPKLFIFSHYS